MSDSHTHIPFISVSGVSVRSFMYQHSCIFRSSMMMMMVMITQWNGRQDWLHWTKNPNETISMQALRELHFQFQRKIVKMVGWRVLRNWRKNQTYLKWIKFRYGSKILHFLFVYIISTNMCCSIPEALRRRKPDISYSVRWWFEISFWAHVKCKSEADASIWVAASVDDVYTNMVRTNIGLFSP